MKIATMAAIQQALEYPDTKLATRFHEGFTIVGDIEPCGMHPHKEYVYVREADISASCHRKSGETQLSNSSNMGGEQPTRPSGLHYWQ